MEFLAELLPIIIYFLLIIVIIVGIVLGIKLIITIDKVLKIVDDVNEKVERITPMFDAFSLVSNKVSNIITSVVGTFESIISKLFIKNRDKEMESDLDE